MTDRELLEFAAKAAGIVDLQWESDGSIQNRMNRPTIPYECHGVSSAIDWNPQTDDGDNRRLQVALKISLAWDSGQWKAYTIEDGRIGLQKNTDPKMAVLLVAAEIGKAMP